MTGRTGGRAAHDPCLEAFMAMVDKGVKVSELLKSVEPSEPLYFALPRQSHRRLSVAEAVNRLV